MILHGIDFNLSGVIYSMRWLKLCRKKHSVRLNRLPEDIIYLVVFNQDTMVMLTKLNL